MLGEPVRWGFGGLVGNGLFALGDAGVWCVGDVVFEVGEDVLGGVVLDGERSGVVVGVVDCFGV